MAVTLFAFPANMVFGPLGANGFVAMILALLLFVCWIASAAWGLHDPIPFRHPARLGLGILWIVTVMSFVHMGVGPATVEGKASAERWIITLLAVTGVVMVTAESVRSREALLSLVRALLWGATFCAVVALYQAVFHSDPTHLWTNLMIGMHDNGGVTTFQLRSSFVRVAGTTFTPIELGVVMTMMVPLAIWRGLYDDPKYRWTPWIQTVLLVTAAVLTVSRSMILGVVVICIVMIPFLPAVARRWAAFVVPAGVLVVFLLVPGMIATIVGTVTVGGSDPSITTRTNNYPRVEAMVSLRPFLGTGPGTYMPVNALRILDNQYLKSAVEMGLLGVLAVTVCLALPAVAALMAARHLRDPMMKALAGCVAASSFVVLVASATFDSFSFPVFTMLFPFFAGLSGVVWLAARRDVGPIDGEEVGSGVKFNGENA